MKLKLIGLTFIVVSVFVSCSNDSKPEENKETKHEVEQVEGLTLNNGEKWEANSETHKGMTQIKTIIENMDALTLDDYHLMGNKCDEQTTFIISNCSMGGEAHNQLHHVLHPILDDIDSLITSKDIESAEKAFYSLEKNIKDYFSFFKV